MQTFTRPYGRQFEWQRRREWLFVHRVELCFSIAIAATRLGSYNNKAL